MTGIGSVVLEVADPAAAQAFYAAAFGTGEEVSVRGTDETGTGFRAFALSLVVSQPGTVDNLMGSAQAGGATVTKPAAKTFWGYGGVVQAPDGSLWKIATSAKKDTEPANRRIDDIVLLLGVADVKASKRFYVERGLAVKRSFGGKYAEFEAAGSRITLALYPRHALAKDAGVPADGIGPHRLVIGGAAEPFTDPDGFRWEAEPA